MRDIYNEEVVFIIFSYFRIGFFWLFLMALEGTIGTHDILSILEVQFLYLQKDPFESMLSVLIIQ